MSSFFSTLFGGGAERDAANANRGAISGYTGDANRLFDTGLNRSVGALTNANGSANGILDANSGLWSDYFNRGASALDSGLSRATGYLNDAGAAYDPLASLGTKYGGATTMLLNSLGVNGAAGNKSAVDAFQAGPGYQWTLDQGLKAADRARAARGMLNSGNTTQDEIKFGTGLANQTYNNWQNSLGQFLNPELSATSGAAGGKAGVFGNIANLIGQDTAARLGLLGNSTTGQAGVNTAKAANDIALGNSLGSLYTNDASNRVGVAGNALSGNVAANNMEAQGQANGARNLLGAGLGVANLAMGGLGGGLGGGSSWFSSLLGGGPTANGYNVGSTGGVNPFPTPAGGYGGATYGGAYNPYAGGFRQ